MTKILASVCVFLLTASACLAQGWNDYQLDIGDGYSVFRPSGLEMDLIRNGHQVSPQQFSGPLVRYLTTPKHIMTMNLTEHDYLTQEADLSKASYFIIDKGTEAVVGPLSKEDFAKRPEVASLSQLDWKTPRNPSFWIPLLGTIFFIVLAIPMLAIKFFWIIIPIVVAILVLRNAKWRREEAAKAKTPLE